MSAFKIPRTMSLNKNLKPTESSRWEFEYGDQNEPGDGFNCNMKCVQCFAKNGKRRCKRVSCYTIPYCWQHLKKLAFLRIGRTTLIDPITNQRFKFLGLFACSVQNPGGVVFKERDPITPYIGDVFTQAEMEETYGDATAPYAETIAVTHGEDLVVDGACMRGVASMANDINEGAVCDGGACRINSYFYSGNGKYPTLVAERDIMDGEEIFAEYGDEYWEDNTKPFQTTPRRVYEKLEYKC